MKTKSISIKFKTITLIVGIILTMSIIISAVSIYEMNAVSEAQIEQFKKKAYEQKTAELRSYVQIAKSIIAKYDSLFGTGGKGEALDEIEAIRFGKSGYFWIQDTNLKMLMHPIKPSLNGKDLSAIKDTSGKLLFNEMDEVAKKDGEGMISYMWPKPGEADPQEKFSYINLFEPWGWVIGTGAYVDDVEKTVAEMKEKGSEQINSIIFHVTGFTITIMILSYFLVIFAFNYVMKKPLERFKVYFEGFLRFITMQDNKFKEGTVDNVDEISELILMLNDTAKIFDKKLKDDVKVMGEVVLTADKIEQGIYKCRIKSVSDNPMIMTLRNTINKMLLNLETNMVEVRHVLESYGNDDFTKRIQVSPRLKEEMLAVINGVNSLGETLTNGAKTNLSNGETLEDNSIKLTSSMNNLAAKANEQAASLEQTAAALEEITSITRSNADNASKMAALGQTVRKSVGTGQDLASKTASSMDEINEKVTAINEAITVIDQIAFQTNILSLNAAVEAATAGEAGKGFAVVAQEVRNLAARSAEAAKEIKELVEDATLKANDGKVISGDMINGYDQLNKDISETIHIIEDVSSASKEQMTGIEQINDAVTMLDRVTQENASETNNVLQITKELEDIANDLVSDAKSKNF